MDGGGDVEAGFGWEGGVCGVCGVCVVAEGVEVVVDVAAGEGSACCRLGAGGDAMCATLYAGGAGGCGG